jgi:phage internal scaffolding protein
MTKQMKISEMVFRTCYDNNRKRVQTCYAEDRGRTHQEHKQECDINHILEKYARTGLVTHVSKYEPQYGDVTSMEYQDMQNKIADVNSMFADLPAKERQRFNNDPSQFLAFVSDLKNVDDMRDGVIGNNSTEASEVASDEAVESAPEAQ